MGDLSPNFSAAEFTCRHCRLLVGPDLQLVNVLQRVRNHVGLPLRIVSGYRCRAHNAAVGGSTRSQHLLGRAADVPGWFAPLAVWQEAGATGVGVREGLVVHVDVRRDVGKIVFRD